MFLAALAAIVFAPTPTTLEPISFTEGLGITTPGGRRTPIQIDPVQKLIVENKWSFPKAGDKVGNSEWTVQRATADGGFSGGATRGGYLAFKIDSPTARAMLLEASGSSVSYVNGAPRGGDPYQYGWLSLPVELKKGANEFLFVVGRGAFRAKLVEPVKPISWDPLDATLPDVREGHSGKLWAAMVVRNATKSDLAGLTIEAIPSEGNAVSTKCWRVPAMSIRKVGFELSGSGETKWKIKLKKGAVELDSTDIELRSRAPFQSYKRTFLSRIDGSVQYYAVMPSSKPDSGQALVLSLHGASVEAMGQADAYGQKSWAHIVAPTNRRPFGFDWEEIGRLDALEVLQIAQLDLRTDPQRTYLTGHSMGGHGTWQIGAHYPGKFAAIGPSAGWISFQTYAGGVSYADPTPIESILERAMSPSLTLMLKDNYWNQAVYILHGDADDNVPVAQARQMRKELEGHPDLQWFEQPGAGHWWDASDAPGADCVDWAPMFETFAKRRIPELSEVSQVRFTTISPFISSKCYWATIQQQIESFRPSKIDLKYDPTQRKLIGSSTNVRFLTLDLQWHSETGTVQVELDGQKLTCKLVTGQVLLSNVDGKWVNGDLTSNGEKNSVRGGGFKSIFNRNVVFVFGTSGSEAETSWSRNKARYDAETLYYRGNGSPEVVSDRDFLKGRFAGRNVVLYGNADTNSAWGSLIDSKALTLKRGDLKVGEHAFNEDLGVMLIVPRKGSAIESVAIVGGTSLVGMRLCDRMPFFTSGAGFPDLLAVRPSMLAEGTKGVALAGYFGNDWKVDSGTWAEQK